MNPIGLITTIDVGVSDMIVAFSPSYPNVTEVALFRWWPEILTLVPPLVVPLPVESFVTLGPLGTEVDGSTVVANVAVVDPAPLFAFSVNRMDILLAPEFPGTCTDRSKLPELQSPTMGSPGVGLLEDSVHRLAPETVAFSLTSSPAGTMSLGVITNELMTGFAELASASDWGIPICASTVASKTAPPVVNTLRMFMR